MGEPYIAERQTALWTSNAVHNAFNDLGFRVEEWPLTQHLEKVIPADSVYFSSEFSKFFGLQYKTIYHNGVDYWPLDETQHNDLQNRRWIFYCCSELRDPSDRGIALHKARFYKPQFPFDPRLDAQGFVPGRRPYVRWGTFYNSLKECKAGVRITSPDELKRLLGSVQGVARNREVNQMSEVLLADFRNKVLRTHRTI